MIHIVLWKWNDANARTHYTADHVNAMVRMIRGNMRGDYRTICITDDSRGVECDTFPLWPDAGELSNYTRAHLPSCYRRLKLYDPETQYRMGMLPGDRIVSLDIDAVITGSLNELLATPGRYVGWGLPGTHKPRVYNGSLQMFTAGDLGFIWKYFDPLTSPKEAYNAGYLGSDQSWLSLHFKHPGFKGDVEVGSPAVCSFPMQTRIQGLDPETRIVFFHGTVKPWDREAIRVAPWITKHWSIPHAAI